MTIPISAVGNTGSNRLSLCVAYYTSSIG